MCENAADASVSTLQKISTTLSDIQNTACNLVFQRHGVSTLT